MRQLSGTDTMMLFTDRPHAQNMIAPVNIYDPSTTPTGKVDFEDVLAFIQARLHISETFRERLMRVPLGLDRPYWIRDENFDIEYHVRQIALPAPGTWRQFCTQVARLCERPLDMSRPPWELYIVEGLDSIVGVPKGAFAMVLKLHHAAVDGVGGAEMISVLHDKSAALSRASVELASPPSWAAERAPSNLELLTRAGLNAIIRPVGFVGNVVPSVRRIPSSLRRSRGDAPRGLGAAIASTRFNGDISAHRVFGAVRFELSSVKVIKNSVDGAKVNDVALALVGGALRRYLDDKGELPKEPLVALMPISIRPTMTQRPKESDVEASAGGNRFAMLPISMATDISDPIERFRTIQRATSIAKGVDAASARTLTDLSEVLPGALLGSVQRAVVRAANRWGRTLGVHTMVTNVPGPSSPIYFCGAKALFVSGMAPIVEGWGLSNAIGSYNGDFPISFTADREMMPDPDFYERCLEESFNELSSAVSATKPHARELRHEPPAAQRRRRTSPIQRKA